MFSEFESEWIWMKICFKIHFLEIKAFWFLQFSLPFVLIFSLEKFNRTPWKMILPAAMKNCLSKLFNHILKRGWNKTISIYKTEDNDEEKIIRQRFKEMVENINETTKEITTKRSVEFSDMSSRCLRRDIFIIYYRWVMLVPMKTFFLSFSVVHCQSVFLQFLPTSLCLPLFFSW